MGMLFDLGMPIFFCVLLVLRIGVRDPYGAVTRTETPKP
jgi:hypothetical protein